MKNFYQKPSILLVVLLSFNLVSCSNNAPTTDTHSKKYSFETAQKHGDVIQKNEKVYNIEKLDTFIEKYNSNEGNSVRITRFNEKDEPLIVDLTVKKEKETTSLYYDVDYSKTSDHDKENKEIQYSNSTCQKILKEISSNSITYKLQCPDIIDLIRLPK
jgi:pyoverdine/dityrosine biosynthesis protein Dit1